MGFVFHSPHGCILLNVRALLLRRNGLCECPRDIGELETPEVTWGEILQQRKFDFRVGQIFTEILWESVLGVGLLAFSFMFLPLVHISQFTTRLVNEPLTQLGSFAFGLSPRRNGLCEEMVSMQI
ncbi:Uncharacterized protein Fot_55746 [Forsythia ovata]|uniref:Uncharacterized protein n=1 Tax=Forsythia ovata TaxID=205694 RepID=A0ABD1P3F0_9LAMI